MFEARRRALSSLGDAGSIGLEMAVLLLVGVKGGEWLDGKFGTDPWLMRAGLAFGILAGFRNLFRAAGYRWAGAPAPRPRGHDLEEEDSSEGGGSEPRS